MEGALVINDFDLMSMQGGNISYVVTVNSFITDGTVTIDLVRVKENPQINGIEVYDDGQPIPLPTIVPQSIGVPTLAPLPQSPVSTNASMSPVASRVNATTFQDIVINCGGTSITTALLLFYILSRILIL